MKLKPFKPLQSKAPSIPGLELKLPAWFQDKKIMEFIQQNRAGFAAGAVILGVLVIFAILYFRHQQTVSVRSSSLFRDGQSLYQYRIPPPDSEYTPIVGSEEEKYQRAQQLFSQIIENYPGSRFAPASLLYIGNCRFKLRQYASALEAFDQFLSRYGGHHLALQALLGRGDCLEQLGKHQEALECYRKLMALNTPLVTEASLGAVRCLLKMTELDKPNANRWWSEAAGILQRLANGSDDYGKRSSRSFQKLLVDLSKAQ